MKWFFIIILAILLLKNFTVGILATILFFLFYYGFKKSPTHEDEAHKPKPIQPRQSSNLTAGDLADLVLLRLELQNLLKSGQIDSDQQAELTQRIDALCKQHLAGFAAVPDNALWQKRRTVAWDLLNHHAETPLGQPPWMVETLHDNISTAVESEIPITVSPLTIDLNTPASVETLHRNVYPTEPALFAIDEEEHSSAFLHPVNSISDNVIQQANKPEPTLNQYAWKPHEPSRLERALTTLSGWHSLAVPFLVQNIGWFIGVFCFIAGSAFLVHSTKGYASNLIAFFAFFIFTLALLFGGYQLRHKRPELETSSTVIFILSLLLIPLTTITATQLLISSAGLGLQILSGLLVLIELGVFYFAVTLVAGLMDRSLQQGLPRFFLALTATQLLQVVLLGLLPFWQLLAVIHLLIFALLSVSIYLFANQWLQSIFIDKHKIGCVAAGMLVYSAVVAFVFINVGNDIVLPAGYYGFFLMLLCMLLFFIDAQLKQWINQYAALSRFSFLIYGLSVLALCLVAQHPIARLFTLVLAIGLYAFIVWRYLTLTPLTILLVCYFWLYSTLVLQFFPDLPDSWYFLASLPVLLSLYRAAHWALNKRQSAYLALIVYRVFYSLLTVLIFWTLSHSVAELLAMITAITAGVLIYFTLKSAPQAIFTPYSKIDTVNVNSYQNLLDSRWFYSLPLLAAVTVFYTPRLPVFTNEAQFSFGLLLLSGFWVYQGLGIFFKSHNTSPTTRIEQRLNSGLLSVLVGLFAVWIMPDHPPRIVPLLLAGMIILWLSVQLLSRWMFYAVLILWCTAFALLKLTYFPAPSNGLVTVLLGIGIWWWLWTVERQELSELTALRREQIAQKMELLPSCQLLGWFQVPSSEASFKDLITKPLEQFMCLLWLLSMKSLAVYALSRPASYAWLCALCLAVLFSVLLIIRYLLIKLLPLPIGLLLTTLLMMLLHIGGLDAESLLLVSVLFGLIMWRGVIYSLAQPFFIRLADALNPDLSSESENIKQITHLSAFFIVLASVILQLLTATTPNLTLLLTLITTAGFLWLSDRTYPQLLVRYLVLGFSVLTGMVLIALSPWQALTTDNYAALLFTLLSLAVGALVAIPTNAYTKPAAHTAILLAFIGIYLQIIPTGIIAPLDYTVLFLAGFSLLRANAKLKWTSCTTVSLMVLVLATLWLENSLFHAQQAFSLWLGIQTFADLWLVLGLLSLAMSLLSHRLKSVQKWADIYCLPLNTVATLGFTWSLLGTLTLFFITAGQANLLAILLLVSLLTLFSLSKNRSGAAQSRGLASACLPTLMVFSLLPVNLDGFSLQATTALCGYALWCCASFILPTFNKRYNDWTITPDFFPWLGLLLVVFSGCWWQEFNAIDMGVYCLELSVYCLLMLRYSRWVGFSWASALAFTAAGIAFNSETLPITILLWGNLQLLLVNFWNRKGDALAERWQWQTPVLALAFESTAKLIFIAYLLIASLHFIDGSITQNMTLADTLLIGILLNLSFLHALWLRFSVATLHGFIWALFLLVWSISIYFTCLSSVFHLPLFLTLWSIILLITLTACSRVHYAYQSKIIVALTHWLQFSVIVATVSLLTYSADNLAESLLSLSLIICLSAILGWRSSRSTWLVVACVELLLFLHLWPFLLVDIANVYALLPWYALQTILFASLSTWLTHKLASNPDTVEPVVQTLQCNVSTFSSWLIALSLLELGAHGILVKYWITSGAQLPWLLPNALATLSTGLIISFIGIRHVRNLPDSKWLYGIVTLIGALIFYSRLVIFKTADVSLWDTSLLIVFAYSLFFIQRLFPSKPLLNMALFMPILVIFTVPLQLASPETSVALIATGLLYLLMRHHTQQKIPLYLALLAFNAGVYLWIPRLVDSSQLIQVYVIPAALSSLMLLHLHSRELKPSVLMGSRLAAISSIYACATVDVFLRAELSVFILAMALSVAGILLGIALKTRAFLYAGVSFLLLNVLGQLRLPEQGLGKAIVLMVMGTLIISVMIWFNIKRVAILQRISAIQAEMQTWE